MNKKIEIFNQNFENQFPEEENKNVPTKKIKTKSNFLSFLSNKYFFIYIITGVLILVILIISFIRSSFYISRFKMPVYPTPSSEDYKEEIVNPSSYATDPEILGIENRLNEINNDLDRADLKETGLNLPVIDLDVNFQE